MSVFLILSIIFNWKSLVKNNKNTLIYLLSLIVILGILSDGKTAKYSILYFPYIFLIIASSIIESKNIILKILLVLFIIFNLILNIRSISDNTDVVSRNNYISGKLDHKNVNILSRERYVFNQIENYNVRAGLTFEWYFRNHYQRDFTIEDFFHYSSERNNKYIIIETKYFNKPILNKLTKYSQEVEKLE